MKIKVTIHYVESESSQYEYQGVGGIKKGWTERSDVYVAEAKPVEADTMIFFDTERGSVGIRKELIRKIECEEIKE
jgi:uncharacterized protein YprB with RNaseH-like and TPR domain